MPRDTDHRARRDGPGNGGRAMKLAAAMAIILIGLSGCSLLQILCPGDGGDYSCVEVWIPIP